MSEPTETQTPEALFEQIAAEMDGLYPGIRLGKVFGERCIKVYSKVFAVYSEECMIFKLTKEQHATALSMQDARLFDPSGRNQPMKEWVQVPFMHAQEWVPLAKRALEYVSGEK
jgi:hypothetical protein